MAVENFECLQNCSVGITQKIIITMISLNLKYFSKKYQEHFVLST